MKKIVIISVGKRQPQLCHELCGHRRRRRRDNLCDRLQYKFSSQWLDVWGVCETGIWPGYFFILNLKDFFTIPTKSHPRIVCTQLMSDGSGRVFKYNMRTREVSVILDNVNFANGIELSHDEQYLLVGVEMYKEFQKKSALVGATVGLALKPKVLTYLFWNTL